MTIWKLVNFDGELKNYQSFRIKPVVNALIRIPYIPTEKELRSPNRKNTFNNLTTEKIYLVHRVITDNRIFIWDDCGQGALLAQSQYEVVEEVSDNEIELIEQRREMLGIINYMIKSKNKSKL